MSTRAEKDEVRTDPNTGLEHKVFAGQPIPGNLLSDQEREQQEAGEPVVIGASKSTPSRNVKIADSDEERTDPVTGLTHKVFAGQPIPPNLLSDEEKAAQEGDSGSQVREQTEEEKPEPEQQPVSPSPGKRNKVQTRPDREH